MRDSGRFPLVSKMVAAFFCLTGTTALIGAEGEARKLLFTPPGVAVATAGQEAASPWRPLGKSANRADFESSAAACWARPVKLNGEDYTVLDLDSASGGGEVGEPQLPVFGKFIKVPEGAKVRLVIDQVEWVPIEGTFNIAPRQDAPWDSPNAKPQPFAKKPEVYAHNEFTPSGPVRITDQAKVREQSLIYVAYSPVAFNPARGELKAARLVKWHLEFEWPSGKKAKKQDTLGEREFAPLMAVALDAQPEESSTTSTPAEPPVPLLAGSGSGADYLVITPDALYDSVLPLANWKHAKGYRTRVVRLSEIGSSTATGIASYIQTAYDTWSPAPTYVLIVGDTNYIPAHYKTKHSAYYNTYTATDLYYSTVSGTDFLPDLFLGRLPCASVAECTNMVGKILTVERNPYTGSAMYINAMVAGYFQDSDGNIPDPTDGYEARIFLETSEGVKDYLTWRGETVSTSYTTESSTTPRHYNRTTSGSILHTNGATYVGSQTYLTPANARAAISTAVNAGLWFLQHRDHGWQFGWSDPPFDTGNVGSLVNSNKYPVVFSINCETAWFDSPSSSMAEAWIKKNPGGSHCVIGATRISSSWWNDWFVHGMFECLYGNYLETLATLNGYRSTLSYGNNYVGPGTHIGQMVNFGKMVMYDRMSGGTEVARCKQQYEILELLGDPEQSPRDSYPYTLAATYPTALTATIATNFDVHVSYGVTAQAGALVALVLDPGDYHTAVSDASGNAHFSFTPQTPLPGSNQMSVVASHQNRIPYQGTITIKTLGMIVSLPASAQEGDGVLTGAGTVRIPAPQPSNVTVTLSSTDTTELTVPSSVTILAGQTNATFNLTVVNDSVLDGPRNVQVRATAAAFGDALDQMIILDNEVANLTVSLPASAVEGDAPLDGTVGISMTPQYNVTVSLVSSDTSEVTVPASVVIPAYSSSVNFHATIVDDNQIDGKSSATITASASGQTSGTDSVTVYDNETTNLVLQSPAAAMEGDGVLAGAGKVIIDGTLPTNLVVTLVSSDPKAATVPATVTIPSSATQVAFNITVVDDVLTDGAQVTDIRATAPGFVGMTNSMTVYDNELPPPPVNPTPVDLAADVLVTTGLSWDYFGGVGTGVSNSVYFGTNPNPGRPELLGTTKNKTWVLPRLAPLTTYYWKIVTRRGANSFAGPVWSFTTRGVDHFTWSSIVSPQMAVNPFGVIITARDEFNTIVSNFNQTVQLSGLVGTPAQTLFSDSFEDGNYNGWATNGGSYVRAVTNSTSSAGTYSLTLIGGNHDHCDGLSANLANLQPEFVRFSVRASSTNDYGAYVVLGTGEGPDLTAVFFYARGDGRMGIYEDVLGPHAVPYEANRWYDIKIQFDWDAQRVNYYRDDVLVEEGIPFRAPTVTSLSKMYVYNFDNTQAWWDDFEVISSNQVQQVVITPTGSGGFSQGAWSGSLAVLEPATDMILLAQDAQGHQGYSARFDVVANTRPALAIRDVGVVERDSGTNMASFYVTLQPVATTNVTVNYATADGTATAGADYLAVSGQLDFTPGQSYKYIQVPVLGDTISESNETFTVTLSQPFNALLSNSLATCTIWDDEWKPNVYLHAQAGPPWHSLANAEAMTAVFGTNWFEASFETVNSNVLFSSAVQFIFLDGSDNGAQEMESFLSANSSRMSSWASAGGLAFLNAAPNEGDGMYLGQSINLVYPNHARTGSVASVSHPIFNGPFTPVGTSWSATYFAHAAVTGSGLTPLIVTPTNSSTLLLAEKAVGSGNMVYGGLTTHNFHSPQPQAANLRANILAWAADPRPYIYIGDPLVVEGDSGTTNMYFDISLSRPYRSNVTVNFGTSPGSATAGVDYYTTNGTLVFAPGETAKSVPVRVIGDATREGHETFSLLLSGAVNGVIQDTSGSGTILDDDLPPVVYVRSSVGEPWGKSDYTNALNRVFGANNWQSLYYQSANPATLFSPVNQFIYLEGSDDNAPAMESFLATNLTALHSWVAAGGYLLENAAPTAGDNMYLGFNATLIYPSTVRTSIVVNASHPIVTGPFTPVGTSWSGNYFAHATISGSGLTPLLVNSTNANQVVLAERAYGNGNVVLGGMTACTFHSPQPQGTNLFANILSWAADPKPYISVDNAVVVEGNSGTTNINFTVRLSRPYTAAVTVGFTTASGTASTGSDFYGTNGAFSFAPGETALSLPVRVIGDLLKEGHETFVFRLQSAVNGVILDSDGIGTILDDDLPPYVYMRSSAAGEPWSSASNTNALNRAFGTNNWQMMFYETANSATLFTPVTKFIFMEGGALNANEMETFLSANLSSLYSWVSSYGGAAFLNAAPNEGDGMYLGDGVYLQYYYGTNLTAAATNAMPAHPIFNGPITNVGTSWTGGSFAHAYVWASSGLVPLITNSANGAIVLGEKPYGLGTVLYGGMTPDSFHTPQPQAANLRANILSWAANSKPYVSIGDVTVAEGDSGTVNAALRVSLTRRDDSAVSINYSTSSGSAASGSDYYATNGLLTFAPGQTYKYVYVRVIGDTLGELNETFYVNLSNPTNCVVLDGRGTGTILNDDIIMATVPFVETWETASFRPFWAVGGGGPYRALVVSSNAPHGGSWHMAMDSTNSSDYARNDVTLAIDLAAYTNVTLRFWAKSFFDEPNPPPTLPFQFGANFDGVSVSTDGTWWFAAQALTGLSSAYTEYVVNLDAAVADFSLGYTAPFYIRFSQYDNYPIPTDGIAIDDISISANLRRPILQADGSSLLAEGFSPPNGGPDPGEPVTVSFGIRNDGYGPTTNLVVTLLSGGGVAGPSLPVTLGSVPPLGTVVSSTFTFTATGSCGGLILPTLQLQDGASSLGTLSYPFRLGAPTIPVMTFANSTPIAIPSVGPATPSPSVITVAGYPIAPTRVWVSLKDIRHTWPNDIDAVLVGPGGQKVMLMSDAGSSIDVTNLTLHFFDGAPSTLPYSSQLLSGYYPPTDYSPGEYVTNAPVGPYGTSLGVFSGLDPNGAWQLFVQDDTSGDLGGIDSGWELHLEGAAGSCMSAPPITLVTGIQTNYFLLSFATVLGQSYVVQYTDSLQSPGYWSNAVVLIGNGGVMTFTEPPTNAHRYFRLLVQ